MCAPWYHARPCVMGSACEGFVRMHMQGDASGGRAQAPAHVLLVVTEISLFKGFGPERRVVRDTLPWLPTTVTPARGCCRHEGCIDQIRIPAVQQDELTPMHMESAPSMQCTNASRPSFPGIECVR